MTTAPFVQTDEYDITGEFLWFGVILHSRVFVPWSKGVRKRYIKSLSLVCQSLGVPVYAFQTPSHDPKKRKFIQDVGGVLHHYRTTPEGEKAEIFLIRPLDQSKGILSGWTFQIKDDNDETTLRTEPLGSTTALSPIGFLRCPRGPR